MPSIGVGHPGVPEATAAATASSPAPGLVERYQGVLAVLLVATFFTNAAVYLFDTGSWPLPPLVAVVCFAAAAVPLLLSPVVAAAVLTSPLALWLLAYLAWAGAAFLYSSGSEEALAGFRSVVLACLFTVTALLILSAPGARHSARQAIVAATLVAVALNGYELFHPQAFGLLAGRPAGLYRNPNIAAAAMVLGLVAGQGILPAKWRSGFLLLSGLGVVSSLSRSGILMWLLAAGVLLYRRDIRVGWRMAAAGIGCGLLAVLTVPAERWEVLLELAQVASSERLERLTLAGAGAGSAELSTSVRLQVLAEGWRLFADQPLFGAGLGATTEWWLGTSTHNMYLRFLAEGGVVGLGCYVLGIGALAWRAPAAAASLTGPFLTVWLVYGLFSHNLLEERAGLIVMALVAASIAGLRRVGAAGGPE